MATKATLALEVTGQDAGATKLLGNVAAAAGKTAAAFTKAQKAAEKANAAMSGSTGPVGRGRRPNVANNTTALIGRLRTEAAGRQAAALAAEKAAAHDRALLGNTLLDLQKDGAGTAKVMEGVGAAAKRLATRLAALFAAYKAGAALKGFVDLGVAINTQFESAEIGIAALIHSQTELSRGTAAPLQGVEKFNAALAVSKDQMDRLRVASIKTTATTTELVSGFQSNLAVGLQMGFSLDQVLDTTILITQAMGAMQIPMFQLAQETRALLTGTIDRNARLARGLQITNEQVKAAKEEGRLFEFIIGKLAAFKDAGDATEKSMLGIRSALAEALELFAAASTRDLFEKMKDGMQDALLKIFDLSSGKLTPAFQSLAKTISGVTSRMGDVFQTLFVGAIDGAAKLGAWFEAHRAELDTIGAAVVDITHDIFTMVATAARFAVSLAGAVLQSTALRAVLLAVRDAVRFVAQHFATIVKWVAAFVAYRATVAAISSALVTVIVTGKSLAGVLVGGMTAVLGVWGAWAVAIGAVLALLYKVTAEREKQQRLEREAITEAGDRSAEITRLSLQYVALTRQIAGAKKGSTGLSQAQAQLNKVMRDLAAAGGQQALDALAHHGEGAAKAAEAVGNLARAELNAVVAEKASAQAARDAAKAELARANAAVKSGELAPDRALAQRQRAEQAFKDAENRLTAITAKYEKVLEAANAAAEGIEGIIVAPIAGNEDGDPAERAKKVLDTIKHENDLAARQAALLAKQEEDALTRKYARGEVAARQYYAELANIRDKAFAAESAGNQRLLALPPAVLPAAERENLVQTEKELDAKRTAARAATADELLATERDLADKEIELRERVAQVVGETDAQLRARITRGWQSTIDAMTREGNTGGLKLIEQLINVEVAKERMGQIEEALGSIRARVAAAESSVGARLDSGAISERQARDALVAVYREQETELARLITQYEALAAISPETFDATRLVEFQTELATVRERIEQTTQSLAAVRAQVRDAFQSDLANFLGSAINEVHTLKEALASLALSIVNSLQRITAEFLSEKLTGWVAKLASLAGGGIGGLFGSGAGASAVQTGVQSGVAAAGETASAAAQGAAVAAAVGTAMTPVALSLTGAGTTMAGAFTAAATTSTTALSGAAVALTTAATALTTAAAVPSVSLASGGYVRGPGSTTSDSIPAWLSNREFVLNAKAVERIGVRQLNEWNAGARPVAARRLYGHYAGGGLVAPPRQPNSGGGSSELVVRYDPALIVQLLRSSEGQRTVLRALERNRDAANAALGRRGQ